MKDQPYLHWIGRLLLIFSILLPLVGCGISPQAPTGPGDVEVVSSDQKRASAVEVPDEDISVLTDGNMAFALDLYHQVSSKEENLFYSPYSISVALAMTYAGARGETADQMAETLHYICPPISCIPPLTP